MQPRDALSATFTPEELQAMWGMTPMEWRTLQQRRLLNASERRHGATKRTYMSVVQAIGLGIQLALVHEVGLSYAGALSFVDEGSDVIENMWITQKSSDKKILYTKNLNPETKPDSLVFSNGLATYGRAWLSVDATSFLAKVGDALAARDPEYKKWRAAKGK